MKKSILLAAALFIIFTSCSKQTKTQSESTKKTETAKKEVSATEAKTSENKTELSAKEPDSNSIVTVHFNEERAIKDEGTPKVYKAETAFDVVGNMKNGWNLGNTFDATGGSGNASETSWGMPFTTKAMIDEMAASGIRSIRIPVSWVRHVEDKNYTINPLWMKRVKEVVDWAIEDGMYVILNCHHDVAGKNTVLKYGQGYYPTKQNSQESLDFLVNTWEQISLAFNNSYDEHLMFELMNEPRLAGTNYEWWFDQNSNLCKEAAEVLNMWNQVLVDTVRASGGNNAKRVIGIPGLQASPDSSLKPEFKMPEDDAKMLAHSCHMYTPYSFAMESPGETEFTDAHKKNLVSYFEGLNYKFVKNGYPVYIGEYGATNKNNLDQKVAWFSFFNKNAQKYGMPCFLWDNMQFKVTGTDGNRFNEKYGFYNRNTRTWFEPEILEAIIENTK